MYMGRNNKILNSGFTHVDKYFKMVFLVTQICIYVGTYENGQLLFKISHTHVYVQVKICV